MCAAKMGHFKNNLRLNIMNFHDANVVFVVFLEPTYDENASPFVKALNYLVRHLQPSPVMAHVELIIPYLSTPLIFATYLGRVSGWQLDKENNKKYYLSTTANKWRAVPVFGKNIAKGVRDACHQCQHVEYSLFRYVTALWGVRKFASLIPDNYRDPAHCATITARVLNHGAPGILMHSSAWYGPSTLYAELCLDLQSKSIMPCKTNDEDRVPFDVERLLHLRDEDVAVMPMTDIMSAIRALTFKVLSSKGSASVDAQKQLANALFRWSVLK
jgi:hypothetical protein